MGNVQGEQSKHGAEWNFIIAQWGVSQMMYVAHYSLGMLHDTDFPTCMKFIIPNHELDFAEYTAWAIAATSESHYGLWTWKNMG
jgi:hypothetical protein